MAAVDRLAVKETRERLVQQKVSLQVGDDITAGTFSDTFIICGPSIYPSCCSSENGLRINTSIYAKILVFAQKYWFKNPKLSKVCVTTGTYCRPLLEVCTAIQVSR